VGFRGTLTEKKGPTAGEKALKADYRHLMSIASQIAGDTSVYRCIDGNRLVRVAASSSPAFPTPSSALFTLWLSRNAGLLPVQR